MGGVIDRDFRGDLQVILHNTDGNKEFTVEIGDRIAQLIIEKADKTPLTPTDDLDQTHQATSGFGSTGIWTTQQINAMETKKPEPPGTHSKQLPHDAGLSNPQQHAKKTPRTSKPLGLAELSPESTSQGSS